MKKKILFKIIGLLTPFVSLTNIFSIPTSCAANTKSYNPDGSDWIGIIKGNFHKDDYVVNHQDRTVTYINSIAIHSNNLIIPNYVGIQGKKYRVLIGTKCFAHNNAIVGTVELNEFITTIPNECFRGCVSLTTIIFHRYPTAIFTLAFSECLMLDKVYVIDETGIHSDWSSHLVWVGDYAFNQCFMHGDLVFGASLVYLGTSAFDSCHEVTSLNLTQCKSLHNIPDNAFNSCTLLEKVYLSPSIVKIGDGAFKMCLALSKVFLPKDNMKLSIGPNAFYQCSNFQGFSRFVTFSKLGAGCFSQNLSLSFSPWDPVYKAPVIEENALSSCNITSLSFSPDGPSDVKNYAFSDNPNLVVLDFSAFPGTTQAPEWTGMKIFDCKSAERRRGTIYLPYGGKFSEEWKDFFEINSIPIGPDDWIVKNASGRIKSITEPDESLRTVEAKSEDRSIRAIFLGFKYDAEGEIDIVNDFKILLPFNVEGIVTTIRAVPGKDSNFSIQVEINNIPDGVTQLVAKNITIFYRGLHYLQGTNQYTINIV